jgi:phage shock protein PspC (stress-responsive transcriptional regulator)
MVFNEKKIAKTGFVIFAILIILLLVFKQEDNTKKMGYVYSLGDQSLKPLVTGNIPKIPEKSFIGRNGGVLAGIAYHYKTPVWIIRLSFFLTVFLLLFFGKRFSILGVILIIIYFLLIVIAPIYKTTPSDFYERVKIRVIQTN